MKQKGKRKLERDEGEGRTAEKSKRGKQNGKKKADCSSVARRWRMHLHAAAPVPRPKRDSYARY